MTPDSTPCFTACHKYMLDFKVVFEVLSCDKSLFFRACVIWEVLWMVFDFSVWIFCFLQQNKMKLLECQPTKAKDLFHMILFDKILKKMLLLYLYSISYFFQTKCWHKVWFFQLYEIYDLHYYIAGIWVIKTGELTTGCKRLYSSLWHHNFLTSIML